MLNKTSRDEYGYYKVLSISSEKLFMQEKENGY